MSNEITFLELYKDNREHARHHETQRTTMSNLILIITAAVSAMVSIDSKLSTNDLPLTLFISFLGIFGVIFTIKYGCRFGYHLSVSRKILENSSKETFDIVSKFQRTSESESKYPKWIVMYANTYFWIVLHSCLIIYGAVLSVISYLC